MNLPRGTSAWARPCATALTAGAALASMLALGACQAAPEPPERTPADFSLSLTLLAPGATQSQSLRPVWYVVEPDGTLRAAIGQRMPSTRLPVPIRRLDAREREALWTRVRSADLASSAPRDVAAELAPPASPPAVPTAIIELAHSGTRRAIWIPLSDAGARDRLRAVTGELDRLARRGTPSLE